MAQTIKLKRSATPSNIPSTGQLELGELAINTYDGKVFIKKDDGTESVVEIGGGGGGSLTENSVGIFELDVSDGTSGQVLTTDGAGTLSFTTVAGSGSELVLNTFTYTATSEQTTFTGEDDNTNILSYNSSFFHVYLNGVLLDDSDYGATDGTSIVLGTGVASGDILTIHTYSADVITLGATANSVGILELDVSDGTSGQVLTTDGAGNLSFTSSSGGISTGKAIAMAIVFG